PRHGARFVAIFWGWLAKALSEKGGVGGMGERGCTAARAGFVGLGRRHPPALPTLARVRLQRLSPIGNSRNPPPRAEKAANFFRSSARAAGVFLGGAPGKTSKASTPRPGKAGLKAGHEVFAQAYASNGGNSADAYRKAYPRCKSAHAAETNGSLLLRNTEVAARISEILRRGAERAEITVEQVLRELAKIGFSDIRKAVAWRNEMVAREDEEERKGEDG